MRCTLIEFDLNIYSGGFHLVRVSDTFVSQDIKLHHGNPRSGELLEGFFRSEEGRAVPRGAVFLIWQVVAAEPQHSPRCQLHCVHVLGPRLVGYACRCDGVVSDRDDKELEDEWNGRFGLDRFVGEDGCEVSTAIWASAAA